jgi:hypothetical protein
MMNRDLAFTTPAGSRLRTRSGRSIAAGPSLSAARAKIVSAQKLPSLAFRMPTNFHAMHAD